MQALKAAKVCLELAATIESAGLGGCNGLRTERLYDLGILLTLARFRTVRQGLRIPEGKKIFGRCWIPGARAGTLRANTLYLQAFRDDRARVVTFDLRDGTADAVIVGLRPNHRTAAHRKSPVSPRPSPPAINFTIWRHVARCWPRTDRRQTAPRSYWCATPIHGRPAVIQPYYASLGLRTTTCRLPVSEAAMKISNAP